MKVDEKFVPGGFIPACQDAGLIHRLDLIVPAREKAWPVVLRQVKVEVRSFGLGVENMLRRYLSGFRRNGVDRICDRVLPPADLILEDGNGPAQADNEEQGTDDKAHDRVCRQRTVHTGLA